MFPGVRVFIGSLKQGKQVPERGTSSFSHSGGAARGDREKIPIKKAEISTEPAVPSPVAAIFLVSSPPPSRPKSDLSRGRTKRMVSGRRGME